MKPLLVGLLALPLADAPVPEVPDITVIPTTLLKTMLDDNMRLRQSLFDARKERDEAIDATVTCIAGRTT